MFALAICSTACRRSEPAAGVSDRAYRANNLGVALLEQFKYPEAAEQFRQALTIDSSLGIARINLGIALLYAQDLAGALKETTEAARLLPSAPQPPYVLGLIARAENRTDDAIREFERVRQLDAADVGTSINLGQIYLESRQYPQAITVLRQAVAAEPYNVTAAYNLGLALTRAGQEAEGRQLLDRAQGLRNVGYAVTYGTGYLEQGRYAEAIASTGLDKRLLSATVPPVAFTPAIIGSLPAQGTSGSPFGRRFTAAELTSATARDIATSMGGGLTLIDIENDGDLDVFAAVPAGLRLFRNDGGGAWSDVTAAARLTAGGPFVPIGSIAGDYDNDGNTDIFIVGSGGHVLLRNEGTGTFSDVTSSARLPAYAYLPGAAAMTDVDHDGDLDLVVAGLADVEATRQRAKESPVVFPRDFAPAPLALYRNNGNGTFTETTSDARLQQVRTHAVALVPTDFDNHRDIDLLVVNRDAPPLLLQNARDGTFRDVAADVGLTPAFTSQDETTAVATADVNRDDFPDLFFARGGAGVLAMSDSRGRFTIVPQPAGSIGGAVAAQFADYDNDGLLDLVTWSAERPRLLRGVFELASDVSQTAFPLAAGGREPLRSPRALALADLDGDGRTDIVSARDDAAVVWRNASQGASAGASAQRIQLRGRVSNRLGVGAKVEVRAGSLRARLETSAAMPAVAPADVQFGLGARSGADVVRVLWPSGVLQAEAAIADSPLPSPLLVQELDRKPSSCPFLFTWNGERFEFVTDFMGGGELGSWAGPGIYNRSDPIEYVRIRGDQLVARDGRYDIRVTNELEEALFVDRLRLLAIAHPADVDVFPNEGLTDPPKPVRTHAARAARPPRRAVDDDGHDVTDRIAAIDRRYPDGFALGRIRGYAAPHALTLDLGPLEKPSVLLLTGWTDYAFSSDNLAASHAGLVLSWPTLEARAAGGRWRPLAVNIGIPVGRPQTIAVDLSGHLRPGEQEVRIRTNMRVYWDQILVAERAEAGGLPSVPLDPTAASLNARGFSAEIRPDGKDPVRYDYGRVSLASPWKAMPGRYTREGDVRELLLRSDDMFVIAKTGDQISLQFDAAALDPLPAGWTRTYFLFADGFSKEMDINSGSPHTVEPLPFHAMTRYPYQAPERYPDSPEYERYRATYNTRVVSKAIPSLDTVAK
jgi:Tfp pilus assembly protein PilF